MGSSSDIDISIAGAYRAWRLFRRGKRASRDITAFEYNLEAELLSLAKDLQDGTYAHQSYRHFIVNDSKRREIAVASVRDRVVHRLLYEYLMMIYDKRFIYDVWSCRPNKGLAAAIERTQRNMRRYRDGWLWRSDVRKFFDSVDHATLRRIIRQRVESEQALELTDKIIGSYYNDRQTGLAIGNLTSQICANIYLHVYDWHVAHTLRSLAYVRYGDDMVIWCHDEETAREAGRLSEEFLRDKLCLTLNNHHTIIQPVNSKLHYLGVEFFPNGRRLDKHAQDRIKIRRSRGNTSGYRALVHQSMPPRYAKRFAWDGYNFDEYQ